MTFREIAILVAVLGVLQVALWLAARLLGVRLPVRIAALGAGLPLVFLSPWLLTSRLLVPSDDLSSAVPGATPLAVPDRHALLNDVVYQLLPWELEVRHALAAGRLPLWSDSLEGGSSPWLNPQSGALAPIAMLARPLPIQHHTTATHALKMTIALEGTWLLATALGAGPLAAALGGVGYALSGGIQAWALLPPSATAAWVPWVALAAIRVLRRPRGRRIAAAAVLVSFLLLSGNPEVAAFGLAFAGAWALLLARRPVRGRGLAAGGLAAVLGLALAAPVLWPFLERVPDAQRLAEVAYGRVPLETLDWPPRTWFLRTDAVLLESPLASHAFGRPYGGLFRGTLNWAEAGGGYAGLAALAGAALALAGRKRRRALPFVVTSVAGLVLAAGFLPLRAVMTAIPGFGLVAAGRLLPLVALGLVVAGTLGLDELFRRRVSPWAATLLVPLAALSLHADPRAWNAILWVGLAAAVLAARARPRLAAAAVAAVLAVDLAPWALLLLPRGDTAAFYPATPAIERLRRETAAPGGPWRTTGEDLAVYPSLLPVYGLDEMRPHNPLAPRDQAGVLRAAFDFAPARRYFGPLRRLEHPLLDFLNVKSVVSYSTRPGAAGYRPVPPTLERFDAGELGTFRLLRNREALPRVFVPAAVDVVRRDQLDAWVERLRDPRRVALDLGEAGEWRPAPRRWDPRAVEILAWRPGRIVVRVVAGRQGPPPSAEDRLIATSIPGPSGWRARASSGAVLETVRVNGAFLGVRVPVEEEEIALGYRPPGFVAGVAAGAAALAALGALIAVDRPRLLRRLGTRRGRDARRPRAAWAIAAAAALYLGASLARETLTALRPYWLRGPHSFREPGPVRWRLGSAPVERLGAFLELASQRIPVGSRVAFAGVDLPGTQSAYRAMWATYLLPRHHVVPAGQAWDGEYWIAYRTRLDRPGLELLWENDDGAVYRSAATAAAAAPRGPVLSSTE